MIQYSVFTDLPPAENFISMPQNRRCINRPRRRPRPRNRKKEDGVEDEDEYEDEYDSENELNP
jgi:hypothetical protein